MEKGYTTVKSHMSVPHERTSIFKIHQILSPLHSDELGLRASSQIDELRRSFVLIVF